MDILTLRKVNTADRTAFDALKSGGSYSYTIAADFNRDGVVDAHDANYLPASGSAGGAGGGAGGGGGGGGGAAAVVTPDTTMRTVTIQQADGGRIRTNTAAAKLGDTVTVLLAPSTGSQVASVTVTTASGAVVEATKVSDTKYTFAMPAEEITVSAVFTQAATAEPAKFSDVPADAYFHDAVDWAVGKGVTSGVGGGLFAPYNPCTRSQAVTFLWRAAGSPEPKGDATFSDVDPNGFYYKAVLWAVEQGITAGVGGGRFNPDGECSRSQIVTFLWRFAGKPAAQGGESFTDVPAASFYSEAVTWAQVNGVTSGTGGGAFSPDRVCNRAQIVTFLYRAMAEKN